MQASFDDPEIEGDKGQANYRRADISECHILFVFLAKRDAFLY